MKLGGGHWYHVVYTEEGVILWNEERGVGRFQAEWSSGRSTRFFCVDETQVLLSVNPYKTGAFKIHNTFANNLFTVDKHALYSTVLPILYPTKCALKRSWKEACSFRILFMILNEAKISITQGIKLLLEIGKIH